MAKVTVYSQPACHVCHDVKEYLKSKGVEFEDLDITADRTALNEMVKVHKVRTVPLIVVGDKKLTGFNPTEIDDILSGIRE
jgi:glutaredoxin-like YruB-family protein